MSKEYTREWWKERLPLIQAFADGSNVQHKNAISGDWERLISAAFDDKVTTYRIAHEPKLRPWKPEEVPVGALIRTKGASNCRHLIVAVSDEGVLAGRHYGGPLNWCFHSAEHSTDGGRTWAPCGVMEEQR